MRVTVRMVGIALCLSFVALLGACGSKPAGTAMPAPSPSKTQTIKLQAAAYFKSLAPVLKDNQALWVKFDKLPAQLGTATNAFSVAARINDSYLPAIEQIQARLAAIKPPPGFGVAHVRLEKTCAVENDLLYFLQDSLQRAVYTQTAPPGFLATANRHLARLRKAISEYGIAVRAAARRSGVKVPSRLVPHERW